MFALRMSAAVIVGLVFESCTFALAGEIQTLVGNVQITVVIPRGYCELQKRNSSDAGLLNYLEKANAEYNELLVAFADCEQLKLWRIGKLQSLDDYGYVLTPLATRGRTIKEKPANVVESLCRKDEKLLDQTFKKMTGPLEKRVEELLPTIKVNETRYLGILRLDKKACYIGLIQKLQTESGSTKVMASVWSASLIRGKMINQYLWKLFTGGRTVNDLTNLQRVWVDDLYQSN